MATILVFLLSSISFYFINYLWHVYTYWKRKGIAGPVPLPIVGNYGPVLFGMKSEAEILKNVYDNYPNEKYVGIYQGLTPILLLRDPDIIKKMLVDDFENFRDRYITSAAKKFEKSIFVMKGDDRWKLLRAVLMPMFTKFKLNNMLQHMQPAITKYINFIDNLIDNKINFEFRALEILFSLESIFGIVTGTELNVFQKETHIKKVATRSINLEILGVIRTIEMINQHVLKPFLVPSSQQTYNCFFEYLKPLISNHTSKKSEKLDSILDYFIHIKDTGKISKKINNYVMEAEFCDDDIVQLCATFCLAGLEAVSSSTSLLIHELALDQHLQNKCYEEVKAAFDKHNGEVTVESMSECKYLGMVVDEIYRKTVVSFFDRKCGSKYKIPDSNIIIDEKVYVYVPLQGLHFDPKYFPNPDLFEPERFLPENIDKRPSNVYMPFGVGPRHCLGRHLGKLMTMIAIAVLLHKFIVLPAKTTSDKIVYNPVTKTKTAKGGVWANIQRRE